MLDQYCDKALHRAKRCAVNDDRPMRLVVRADVREIEPLRQLIIHLHSAKLPLAANYVLHDEIDLRPVEGSLAGLERKLHAERLGSDLASGLGAVPLRRFTHVLLAVSAAQADAHTEVGHVQSTENDFHEFEATEQLLLQLIFGAEQVRVILGEPAYASHAAQLSGLFPAIDSAELGKAHR